MFADTLTPNDGTAAVSFTKTKQLPDGAVRMNIATDLTTPELITIRHSSTGQANKGNLVDRHLVQVSRAERDTETGVIHTANVNLTLAIPRTSQFTNAEVERLFTILKNVIPDAAALGQILRGES